MSGKEKELSEAVEGAAKAYLGISKIYFYISREFTPSSKKNKVKPTYQTNIEKVAKKHGITIEWKGLSNIEVQLAQKKELISCRNIFFQVDSEIQACYKNLKKHKEDIFNHIETQVSYKDRSIVLKENDFNMDEFLKSDNQVLIIDGEDGTGKSSAVKKAYLILMMRPF